MNSYLLHHLFEYCPASADKIAIVDGETSYDFAAFGNAVDRTAGWLRAHGVRRGDRVAIVLPKSFAECVAIFAASRADAVSCL